ncbi:thioredoxin-like protein [Rhodocollybia butyracea]|uniref:thioredoxin-dependent peroxiredoxin n=1 Tax=Rhodocollybia butyracea TaxID=206335 RepID=A0A9P5Q6A1_9AGAR|nr:thioredoxin-like protein [Rhodocollybia butyracea]
MSTEAPIAVPDASAAADSVMAPPPAEETPVTVPEVTDGENKAGEVEETPAETEAKDEKGDKEAKAPSRRSTRISSKPQAEASKPKRAPSTRKRAAEDGDEAKTTKKAKSVSSETGLALGSFLPEITLKSEKDVDVEVSLLAKEKGVVLFLVPKADTPGCTTQACGFRDIYAEFTSAEYDVYCLSADPPAAQSKWQDKKTLPYGLLSDPERKLISALGANDKGKTKRSHFIFAKAEEQAEGKGTLIDKKIGVKPADSPKLAMEFIKGYVPGTGTTNGEASTADAGANGTAAGVEEEPVASTEESTAVPSEEAPATNGAEDVTMQAVPTA